MYIQQNKKLFFSPGTFLTIKSLICPLNLRLFVLSDIPLSVYIFPLDYNECLSWVLSLHTWKSIYIWLHNFLLYSKPIWFKNHCIKYDGRKTCLRNIPKHKRNLFYHLEVQWENSPDTNNQFKCIYKWKKILHKQYTW